MKMKFAPGLAEEIDTYAELMRGAEPGDPVIPQGKALEAAMDGLTFESEDPVAISALRDALDFISNPWGLQSVSTATKRAAARALEKLGGKS